VKILPGGKVKPKESNQIIISRTQRAKRKYITTVVGTHTHPLSLSFSSSSSSSYFDFDFFEFVSI
jgi:hypothetical protein